MDSKECKYEHDDNHYHMLGSYGRWIATVLIVSFLLFFMKPFLVQLMLARVSSYFASYSFDEVIRISKKIIFIDKGNVEAWKALGSAYKDKDLINESVAAYEKVFSLDPKDTEVCFNLGMTYFKNGKIAKATQYFEHIRNMKHNSVKSSEVGIDNYLHQSLVMLQQCYEALGDIKKTDEIQQETRYYDTK